MKRLYKIYKYITVFALSFGLFSCSNSITETIAQNSESKAQLCVSMDKSSARTILPESDVSADEITKVELLAKAGSTDSAASVKEWASDDSETAITKMTGDTEILIDAGTYDFTLNLYVSDVLCQVATLQDVTVHAGLNSLSFAAKYAAGSFSLSLTDLAAQGVTAVKAGLFTVESNGETAVTDFALESLTVTEDSVTYAKNNVPGGTYFIRFELYQDGTKIDTLEDIIKIAATRTTTKTLALANINTLYSVTYNLDGGEWAADFTPVTSRNANKALTLPTAANVTKAGLALIGWYTDEECTAENKVTEIAIGTIEDKTFYAKWGYNITVIPAAGDTGDIITASPSVALAGETVTITVEPAEAHVIQGLPSITDADNQPVTFTLSSSSITSKTYTFTMPSSAVTVTVTFVDGYLVLFHKNDGEDCTEEQLLSLNQDNNLKTNEFTRTDFMFAGWATSANGAVVYADGSIITADKNYDLYAVWLMLNEEPQNVGDIVVYNGTDTRFVPRAYYSRTKYPAAGWEPYGIVAKADGEDRFMVGFKTWGNIRCDTGNANARTYHPVSDSSNPYYTGWNAPRTKEQFVQIRGSDTKTGSTENLNAINSAYKVINGTTTNLINPEAVYWSSNVASNNYGYYYYFYDFKNCTWNGAYVSYGNNPQYFNIFIIHSL